MRETIYKYIGFPAFVDLVQRQALHFVLPSEWDDPEETSFAYQWLSGLDEMYQKLMALLVVNRTFAQSWTCLEESDAMWRIYSYDNQALRISVDISKINEIDGVKILPVEYNDSLISYSSLSYSDMLMKYISQKRKAFEHEKEVRLLYVDRIEEDRIEPAIRNLYYILTGQSGREKDIDVNKIKLEELKEYIDFSNLNQNKKSHKVSFGCIPDFIKNVLVHPLAPEWYVDTVKRYCDLNSVPFEGKSKLYSITTVS